MIMVCKGLPNVSIIIVHNPSLWRLKAKCAASGTVWVSCAPTVQRCYVWVWQLDRAQETGEEGTGRLLSFWENGRKSFMLSRFNNSRSVYTIISRQAGLKKKILHQQCIAAQCSLTETVDWRHECTSAITQNYTLKYIWCCQKHVDIEL